MSANKNDLIKTTEKIIEKILVIAEEELENEYSLDAILKIALSYSKVMSELHKITSAGNSEEKAIDNEYIRTFTDKVLNNPEANRLLTRLESTILRNI
jgi:hypothetical protein